MANLSLNANSLLSAAKKIEEAASRIDGSINRIDSIMTDLDTVWRDKNAKEYLARYTSLKEDFNVFKTDIHNYSSFLSAVVETYRKEFVEETNSSVN